MTLDGSEATTTGDSSGTWRDNAARNASEHRTAPLTLRVEGTNTIEINDVLIGEVWLCSGQSNMEWTVDRSTNHEAEIAAADYPLIRHIKVAKRSSTTPLFMTLRPTGRSARRKLLAAIPQPVTSWPERFIKNLVCLSA